MSAPFSLRSLRSRPSLSAKADRQGVVNYREDVLKKYVESQGEDDKRDTCHICVGW